MKLKKIVTSLLLTSLLLTSCAPKPESIIEDVNTTVSIEDLPTPDELKGWDNNEIHKLKSQIEQIPLDSCEEYFTNEIKTFLANHEKVELDHITVEKDNLSVIRGKNQKSLRNLNFVINVIVDTTDHVGNDQSAKDISKQLQEFLWQYSYFNFKAQQLDINCFDLNHTNYYDISSDFSHTNETVFVKQPDDEYGIQTLAFNFSEKNPNFILNKFGVIAETNELYIEYYIHDDYFDFSNIESSIAGLENAGAEIKEYLISNKAVKEFISSKDVSLLTISLYSGNLSDEYIIFNFEV